MRNWSAEESREYIKRFREYRRDTRCRKYSWFGHTAHQCRKEEIEAEREQRGRPFENWWEPLKCRVMACEEERVAVCSARREVQQLIRCWGCGKVVHHLWTCPKKVVCPVQGEMQQRSIRKLVCKECKEKNHIARNCDRYWWWREREVKRKLKELRKKPVGEERVLRCTMQPLREVWMMVGMKKIDTYKGVTVKALLDSGAIGMFADKRFVEKHGFKLEKLDRPSRVTNMDRSHNSGGLITHEIECNVYYKGHVERIRLDVYDLGRTEVILGMPWLAAHNPEIDWEKEEVRITRCPPMCGRRESNKEK